MPALVLIAHNAREQLFNALHRLTLQRPRPKLVVVDNGSEDDTSDLLRTLYPEVTLVQLGVEVDWAVAERAGRAFVPADDCCVIWLDGRRVPVAALAEEPELVLA